MEKLLKCRKEAFHKVEVNINNAQKKQKEIYDCKHLPLTLTKGTEVLLENTKERERGEARKTWSIHHPHTHWKECVDLHTKRDKGRGGCSGD